MKIRLFSLVDGGSASSMYRRDLTDGHQGMYNGRKGMPSLCPPHHLEKAEDITYTMHNLLLLSLIINTKYLFIVRNLLNKGRQMVQCIK
jgi:hypothetical protein